MGPEFGQACAGLRSMGIASTGAWSGGPRWLRSPVCPGGDSGAPPSPVCATSEASPGGWSALLGSGLREQSLSFLPWKGRQRGPAGTAPPLSYPPYPHLRGGSRPHCLVRDCQVATPLPAFLPGCHLGLLVAECLVFSSLIPNNIPLLVRPLHPALLPVWVLSVAFPLENRSPPGASLPLSCLLISLGPSHSSLCGRPCLRGPRSPLD